MGFYTHFTIYVAVNLLLVLVSWFSGAGFPWFIFVFVFWELAQSPTGPACLWEPHGGQNGR